MIKDYDTAIIDLWNKTSGQEYTNMLRGGDTYKHLGWRLKPSRWNWLLTLMGMERYEEIGEWYWADGLEHPDTTFFGLMKRSEPFDKNDTFIWTSSYD